MAEDTRTPPKGLAADRRAVLAGAAAIVATAAATKAVAQTPPAAAGLGTGGASRAIFKTTETANGKVMGIANGPVWEFRGIPYGAPTGGRNRYMPPKRTTNWAGVRECFAFGQGSPQTQSDIRGDGHGRLAPVGEGEHRRLRRRPRPGDDLRPVRRRREDLHRPGHAGRKRPVPRGRDPVRLGAAARHARRQRRDRGAVREGARP